MGFFIDKVKERIASGDVTLKRNGNGFLATTRRYCSLQGTALEEEYETLTVDGVAAKKQQTLQEISNLELQKRNLAEQLAQADREIEARQATLVDYDDLIDHLKNFDKDRKQEKKK